MAAIHNLLNPLPENGDHFHQLPSPSSTIYTRDYSPPPPPIRKRQKVAKDAAIFARSSIRGECRYSPCEYRDGMIAVHHRQYEIYPTGHIAEYPRHIPYNSEKKTFQESTGRESFEVFQYEFRVPGDDKVYCMMWDYNIGLVRTTPLFRCNGYSKTTPAKMLNRNPGLREICHSITGGALVAQGYWMPFEAAKAIAATFCYHIRYALTPVFGIKFPEECLKPDDEGFGEMTIDESITKFCREEAICYRQMEMEKQAQRSSKSRSSTPTEPTKRYPRPKGREIEYVYTTEEDRKAYYQVSTPSPTLSSYEGAWTPVNTPRSINDTPTNRIDRRQNPGERLPRPRHILTGIARRHHKPQGEWTHGYTSSESPTSSPNISLAPRHAHRIAVEVAASDDGYENDVSSSDEEVVAYKNAAAPRASAEKDTAADSGSDTELTDEKAAYLLISLKMGQTSLRAGANRPNVLKKRRASA